MEVVSTKYGKLMASRKDKYLGRSLFEYGEFSEGEVELFKYFAEGKTVCDIGANVGAHTLAFSRFAKYVCAFEPVPKLFNCLAGMVALNDLENVSCFNAGVGRVKGAMSYPALDFAVENNFGAGSLEEFTGERGVMVAPLSIPCDFIKIDVEGMEADVLEGAEPMIKECEPVIYVEADREDKLEALLSVIDKLEYFPYWHTPPLFNPDNFYGNKENVWGRNLVSYNLICVKHSIGAPQATKDNHPRKHYDLYARG